MSACYVQCFFIVRQCICKCRLAVKAKQVEVSFNAEIKLLFCGKFRFIGHGRCMHTINLTLSVSVFKWHTWCKTPVWSFKPDLFSQWVTMLESSGVLSGSPWLAPRQPVPVLWFDSPSLPPGIKLHYYWPSVHSRSRISILIAGHNYNVMFERTSIWMRHYQYLFHCWFHKLLILRSQGHIMQSYGLW